ncbi:hypothetical protein ABZP36_021588 [Zizania latifolia]
MSTASPSAPPLEAGNPAAMALIAAAAAAGRRFSRHIHLLRSPGHFNYYSSSGDPQAPAAVFGLTVRSRHVGAGTGVRFEESRRVLIDTLDSKRKPDMITYRTLLEEMYTCAGLGGQIFACRFKMN